MLVVIAIGLSGCAQRPASSSAAAAPTLPSQVTPGDEIGAALRDKIVVEFASGSDRLSPQANRQLDVAARLFRDVRPASMLSVGYSDAIGGEFENLLLAARRARAVKAALVSRGLPPDVIQLRSYGESDPIESANPKDVANRRVVVSWRVL